MIFDDKPGNIQQFRQSTAEHKPLNLPQMTVCKFCGGQEYRGCMKLSRCRKCYAAATK